MTSSFEHLTHGMTAVKAHFTGKHDLLYIIGFGVCVFLNTVLGMEARFSLSFRSSFHLFSPLFMTRSQQSSLVYTTKLLAPSRALTPALGDRKSLGPYQPQIPRDEAKGRTSRLHWSGRFSAWTLSCCSGLMNAVGCVLLSFSLYITILFTNGKFSESHMATS